MYLWLKRRAQVKTEQNYILTSNSVEILKSVCYNTVQIKKPTKLSNAHFTCLNYLKGVHENRANKTILAKQIFGFLLSILHSRMIDLIRAGKVESLKRRALNRKLQLYYKLQHSIRITFLNASFFQFLNFPNTETFAHKLCESLNESKI